MGKIFVTVTMLLVSNIACAYGVVTATVESVRVDSSGLGIIEFSLPVAGEPAICRDAPYGSHLSFDANTVGGKAIYSMALSANVSGKTMVAIGTGACSEYVNVVESMSYGVIR